MSRPRQARSVETRARLLAAAAAVIAEQGIEGASVDAIAERAERTSGSLYGQFGSKDGLIVELLDASKDLVAESMFADIEAATSLDERLAALWRNFADPPPAARDWVQFEHEMWVWANRPGNDDAGARLARRYRAEFATLGDRLRRVGRRGADGPARRVRPGRDDGGGHAARPRDDLPARPRRHRRGVRGRRPPQPAPGPRGAAVWAPCPFCTPYPTRHPWGTPDATRRDRPAGRRLGAGRPPRRVRPAAPRGAGALAPRGRRPGLLGRDPPRRRGEGQPRHGDVQLRARRHVRRRPDRRGAGADPPDDPQHGPAQARPLPAAGQPRVHAPHDRPARRDDREAGRAHRRRRGGPGRVRVRRGRRRQAAARDDLRDDRPARGRLAPHVRAVEHAGRPGRPRLPVRVRRPPSRRPRRSTPTATRWRPTAGRTPATT